MDYQEFMGKYGTRYAVVKLHCEGKPFEEIGNIFGLSEAGVKYQYRRFVNGLYHCYARFLENSANVVPRKLHDFYISMDITVAAMEEIYKEPLSLFRQGDPPLFLMYFKNIPLYRELTEEQISDLEKKIAGMRRRQRKSYDEIGKMLDLTARKSRALYQSYYHKKVKKAAEIVQPTVDYDFFRFLCDYSHYPHIRWKLIVGEYADLVQELMDEYD